MQVETAKRFDQLASRMDHHLRDLLRMIDSDIPL